MSYRARMPASAPAMGVTVQEMVDASVSGVMFTCNPVSGDPSTVAVNASWGLGLAVVGGEVTPDEYRVSKVTRELLSKTVGPKQVEYLPDPTGAGTVRVDVPAERQEAACLEDEQLEALVDVALRVERHFGSHQDIEWAIDRDGSLFILQSRPVTAAPKKPGRPERRSAISLVMGTFGAGDDAGS
jgi:pyruvate,water dikinase